jgi:hypothetical protein
MNYKGDSNYRTPFGSFFTLIFVALVIYVVSIECEAYFSGEVGFVYPEQRYIKVDAV